MRVVFLWFSVVISIFSDYCFGCSVTKHIAPPPLLALQWMDFAGQENSLHLQQCLQAYELFGRLYFPMYQGSTSYTCPPRSALL